MIQHLEVTKEIFRLKVHLDLQKKISIFINGNSSPKCNTFRNTNISILLPPAGWSTPLDTNSEIAL